MKCLFILIFSLAQIQSFSQTNFGYYFTDVPNANSLAFPVLTRLPDGSIIGTSSINAITDFTLFRMDSSGNILWKKKLSVNSSQILAPSGLMLLNDSTFVMLTELYQISGFCIIKCDFSGNIIWANHYTGIPYFSAQLSPLENGGLVVTERNYIIFINPDGTINFSYDFPSNFTGWESINKNYGVVTIMGTYSNDIYLFDMDTTGLISNSYQYTLVGPILVTNNYVPSNNMAKSHTGGSFVFYSRGSSLIKFDAQNQLIWSKRISVASPSNIVATTDGGCITSSFVDSTSAFSQPLFCKFDSTGNLEWTKAPVDLINPVNISTTAIISDGNNGWYSAMQRNKLLINHIDSVLDGFCSYQNVTPIINTLQIISNTNSVSFSAANIIANPLPITAIPANWYRYDSCSGVLIDSTTGNAENILSDIKIQIYPNPVYSILSISLPHDLVTCTFSLFNSVGQLIESRNVFNKSEFEVELENYHQGLYLVRIQDENRCFIERVVKN